MMGRFKPGLCSVSFRGNSPEEIVRAASAAGLEYIEWGSDVHAPFDDAERLHNIAKLQEEYGIKCSSYGTYFRIGQTDIDELERYVDCAKILGTDLLRLWCGVKGSAVTDENEEKELFDICRKAAAIAEKNGVVLGMECHQWTYTDTAESIACLMDAVDSESFRMYWQPNQFRTFDENIRHIEMTGKYVTAVHIFNWEGDKRLPLADAASTWQDYLSRLDGEYPVLLEFMPDDKIESLGEESVALRNILKGELQ